MTEDAKQDLIMEFMDEVEPIADEVEDGSVPREDLIQEGYVGVMKGAALLEEEETLDAGLSVSEIMKNSIRQSMLDAQEAARNLSEEDDRVIVQVELLNRAIDRLTEELGTKPNIDELANELKIPQDKVLDILKLTGETPDDEAFQNPAQSGEERSASDSGDAAEPGAEDGPDSSSEGTFRRNPAGGIDLSDYG